MHKAEKTLQKTIKHQNDKNWLSAV